MDCNLKNNKLNVITSVGLGHTDTPFSRVVVGATELMVMKKKVYSYKALLCDYFILVLNLCTFSFLAKGCSFYENEEVEVEYGGLILSLTTIFIVS